MRWATGARVRAEGLTLTTREGPVYTNVDLTAAPGTLNVFRAESGGGRSALLLSLTGRMFPTSGDLQVDGFTLPRQARKVRRISSLGLMEDVNALEERLRVREHLTEAVMLRSLPARSGLVDQALAAADVPDIDRHRLVKDLTTLERKRLGIALALLDEPRLLAVDDVDEGLDATHQGHVWQTLTQLAEKGLTIIATCADAGALEQADSPLVQGPLPIRQDPTAPSPRPSRARLRGLLHRDDRGRGDRAEADRT